MSTFSELQHRHATLLGTIRVLDGVMQYLRLLLPPDLALSPPELPFTRQDLLRMDVPPDSVLAVLEHLGGQAMNTQAELAQIEQLSLGAADLGKARPPRRTSK